MIWRTKQLPWKSKQKRKRIKLRLSIGLNSSTKLRKSKLSNTKRSNPLSHQTLWMLQRILWMPQVMKLRKRTKQKWRPRKKQLRKRGLSKLRKPKLSTRSRKSRLKNQRNWRTNLRKCNCQVIKGIVLLLVSKDLRIIETRHSRQCKVIWRKKMRNS